MSVRERCVSQRGRGRYKVADDPGRQQITHLQTRRGGSTQMSAHDGVDEHHVAVAAALKRARDAVAALAEPSPTFMDGMRSALQQAERQRCSSSREEGGRGGMN